MIQAPAFSPYCGYAFTILTDPIQKAFSVPKSWIFACLCSICSNARKICRVRKQNPSRGRIRVTRRLWPDTRLKPRQNCRYVRVPVAGKGSCILGPKCPGASKKANKWDFSYLRENHGNCLVRLRRSKRNLASFSKGDIGQHRGQGTQQHKLIKFPCYPYAAGVM